jgi:nucleoside permease NupC
MNKVLGDKEIESVLQRLDRLTLQESQMTVAQVALAQTEILTMIRGLVDNMRVVMEGAHLVWLYARYEL